MNSTDILDKPNPTAVAIAVPDDVHLNFKLNAICINQWDFIDYLLCRFDADEGVLADGEPDVDTQTVNCFVACGNGSFCWRDLDDPHFRVETDPRRHIVVLYMDDEKTFDTVGEAVEWIWENVDPTEFH